MTILDRNRFLIISILLLGIGLLGILAPSALSQMVVIILGLAVLGYGCLSLWLHFRGSSRPAPLEIIISLTCLVIAYLLISHSQAAVSVVYALLGLYLLVQGAIGLIVQLRLGKVMLSGNQRLLAIVLPILLMLGGLLITINPHIAAIIAGLVGGGYLLVRGVSGVSNSIVKAMRG